jgi:hypothetical protein
MLSSILLERKITFPFRFLLHGHFCSLMKLTRRMRVMHVAGYGGATYLN